MIQAKNPLLRELFEQLRFAPAEQKQKHLAAAEKLLLTLNAGRQYPFDFVVFRLTGYRSRSEDCQQLVEGKALLEDLRIWTRQLGSRIEKPAEQQGEAVLSVSELAKRFSVADKTIRRWREKGLIGRLYRFPDGIKRKGFTASAVAQFCAAHPEVTAASFKRLTGQQKQQVITVVSEIAEADPGLTRRQLLLRASRKLNRHPQTINYILRRFERDKGGLIIPPPRPVKVSVKDVAAMYRLRKQGATIEELAKTYGRSRSSVHRIIAQHRARELAGRKIEFVGKYEFNDAGAEEFLAAGLEESAEGKAILLTRRQEETLFRAYNYLKFRAASLLADISVVHPRFGSLRLIEKSLEQAGKVRQKIIESNLPLVVSIANRHVQTGGTLAELVSRGNLSLMRAVEKFDCQRGYRFSTYASLAIAKDFARYIPADARRLDRPTGSDFAELSSQENQNLAPDIAALEQAQRGLRKIIENELDQRQRYIILNHFALDEGVIPQKPKTLKQIGAELGLSKERVRQLELQALQKLRHSLSPEQFDLLTG